jgi:hypothetical protein
MPDFTMVGNVNRVMSDEEQAAFDALRASDKMPLRQDGHEARGHRQGLLDASDWTQTADSPLTTAKKAAWATYRSTLRDLPTVDAKWPVVEEITWPTEPS